MAEPSEEYLKKITEIFLSDYNEEHKTDFQWNDKKSYVAKGNETPWADAIVFDGKKQLYLQHKEVVWDEKHHKARASYANKLVNHLIDYLHRMGLDEYTIHVNIHPTRIPSSNRGLHEIAFNLEHLIKLRNRKTFSARQPVFSYDKDDDIFLSKLKEVFSYIHIFHSPGKKKPGFGFGWSTGEIRPLPHYGDVVTALIERKATNDKDVVLLLDATTAIDEYDMSLIENGLKNEPINQEVWIVENFFGKERASRLN
jgi:hypothetical protein